MMKVLANDVHPAYPNWELVALLLEKHHLELYTNEEKRVYTIAPQDKSKMSSYYTAHRMIDILDALSFLDDVISGR